MVVLVVVADDVGTLVSQRPDLFHSFVTSHSAFSPCGSCE